MLADISHRRPLEGRSQRSSTGLQHPPLAVRFRSTPCWSVELLTLQVPRHRLCHLHMCQTGGDLMTILLSAA